jgi:DNA invertase Pin-like site-specific DNA recombinase
MRRLKMSGMLNKEIAEKMGRSYTAVQVIVTDLTKATRNEADQKRAIIRQLRDRGATYREITRATGAKKTEIQWAVNKPVRVAGRSR